MDTSLHDKIDQDYNGLVFSIYAILKPFRQNIRHIAEMTYQISKTVFLRYLLNKTFKKAQDVKHNQSMPDLLGINSND